MAILSDILVIVFGIIATIVGIGAILATLYARGHRIRLGDPERPIPSAPPHLTQSADPMTRLIELLPEIIHGHHSSTFNRNNRIRDTSRERLD
ncbi:hypothetical protein DL98DRAFT_519686 [Cadophora sp. DSE1049]|nr:hypothetical protein DL98DRAFT_519686 [Cadophora sp. DSE1049]